MSEGRRSPVITVCMRYKDLFDAEPTMTKAQSLLRVYDRSDVIATLAKLNALLKTWRRIPDFEIDHKIAKDFFPDSDRRARIAAQQFPNPIFFTRLGILATMRLALEECSSSGGKPVDGEGVAYVLACCIMMNDLTNPTLSSAQPTPATILTSAIHLHDSTVRANFFGAREN